jgi:hypothetical protein
MGRRRADRLRPPNHRPGRQLLPGYANDCPCTSRSPASEATHTFRSVTRPCASTTDVNRVFPSESSVSNPVPPATNPAPASATSGHPDGAPSPRATHRRALNSSPDTSSISRTRSTRATPSGEDTHSTTVAPPDGVLSRSTNPARSYPTLVDPPTGSSTPDTRPPSSSTTHGPSPPEPGTGSTTFTPGVITNADGSDQSNPVTTPSKPTTDTNRPDPSGSHRQSNRPPPSTSRATGLPSASKNVETPPNSCNAYAYAISPTDASARPGTTAPGSAATNRTSSRGYPASPVGEDSSIANDPPDAGETRTPPVTRMRDNPKDHPRPSPEGSTPIARESHANVTPPADSVKPNDPSSSPTVPSSPSANANDPNDTSRAPPSDPAAHTGDTIPPTKPAHSTTPESAHTARPRRPDPRRAGSRIPPTLSKPITHASIFIFHIGL